MCHRASATMPVPSPGYLSKSDLSVDVKEDLCFKLWYVYFLQ